MHPVIPTNAREASRDTTLPHGGGKDGRAPLFVPKGTVVLYDMYTMHRDSGVYGLDTEEFVPERWDCLRPGWSFLPFSGGPRICIGRESPFPLCLCGMSTNIMRWEDTLTVENRAVRPPGGLLRHCPPGAEV